MNGVTSIEGIIPNHLPPHPVTGRMNTLHVLTAENDGFQSFIM